MAQNLAWLPSVNANADTSTTVSKYYVYDYNGTVVSTAKAQANYTTYGVFYNYQAALTACPIGWLLPDTIAWHTLEAYVGGTATAGNKLKAVSSLWTTYPGITNTDDYGFSALPAGYYNGTAFGSVGNYGHWWAMANVSSNAYYRYMDYGSAYVYHYYTYQSYGFSVRCLKNP